MKKLICLFLLISAPALATTECKSSQWTKPRDLPIKGFKEILDATVRQEVIAMAWGEILNDSNKTVAAPLLQYLAGTEPNATLRGYYKAMNSMITNGMTPEESIQAWPKRVMARKPIYNLQQMCDLYRKSGGK